jgi:RNA recognition motif-containing protein
LWLMPEAAAAAAESVRKIVVSIAQPPAQGGARESAECDGGSDARQGPATAMSGGSASAAASSSCFVGNLPAEATAKEVRAVFRDVCGPATIRKVRMLPSVGETRRAFIDFVQAAAATAAVGKSGLAALGRVLIVSYSRRSEAPSGDGRRSREARVRRRLKREEQREQAGSASASKPVLAIKSPLLHIAAA